MNNQAEFYDWFATAYEFLYREIDAERTVQQWNTLLQTVLPAAQGNSCLRLLDVGCGPGWHLPHWHGHGFEVSGLDVSTAMLKLANAQWAKEVGGEAPPLYCADLSDLGGPILTAPPFDFLVLHSNLLHLFSPETLPSVLWALKRLGTSGALMIADFTSTTLVMESSREITTIAGISWECVAGFDPAKGILRKIWKNDTKVMTELCWPVKAQEFDIIAADTGWGVQSRFGWDPQNFEAPFNKEWAGQTRWVTIYGRTAES